MWPAIASIGSSIIGGIAGLFGANQQNSAAQANAQQAQQFEKSQTDTAHQREVADLKAAGLNPILSAGGNGASSASGVVANVVNPAESMMRGAEAGANSAAKLSTVRAQLDNLAADTALKSDSAKAARASTIQSLASAKLATENSATVAALRPSQMEKAMWDAGISGNEFGATVPDAKLGQLKKGYLDSPVGQFLTNIGFGGSDLGRGFSAANSAKSIVGR